MSEFRRHPSCSSQQILSRDGCSSDTQEMKHVRMLAAGVDVSLAYYGGVRCKI